MATVESARTSLTEQIKKQIELNRKRGDKESFFGGKWLTCGRNIWDYESSFIKSGLLKGSLSDLLKDKPFVTVIDLMSPSNAVFTLFFYDLPEKSKLGLSISLEDQRTAEDKDFERIFDVEQIPGDILKSSTWGEIENKLKGHKADLIMERGLGGLRCIPKNPKLCAIFLNKMWVLLNKDNGTIFAGVPLGVENEAKGMMENFKNNGLDASIGKAGLYHYLKLVKTSDSPERLPFHNK